MQIVIHKVGLSYLLKTVCVVVLLASFPALAQEQESLSARFSLQVKSDSSGVRNRHFTVTQYADQACAKASDGTGLYRKKFAKETHSFKQVDIATQAPFYFQVAYLENRRQGQRSCDALVGFVPQANRSYLATYEVSGQVSRCAITVVDVTSAPEVEVLELSKPEKTCGKNKPSRNKNAVPVHTIKPLF